MVTVEMDSVCLNIIACVRSCQSELSKFFCQIQFLSLITGDKSDENIYPTNPLYI